VWQPARMRRPLVPLTLVAGIVLLAALAAFGRASGEDPAPREDVALPPVRVAAGPDAESSLLAHTLVAMLAVQEVDARVVSFGDARDTRQALERGDVELRPGYTGEAWLEALGRADPPGDSRASFERSVITMPNWACSGSGHGSSRVWRRRRPTRPSPSSWPVHRRSMPT
jgi:glycine betaine/choline ABC-type transport system substrate-binding protein